MTHVNCMFLKRYYFYVVKKRFEIFDKYDIKLTRKLYILCVLYVVIY